MSEADITRRPRVTEPCSCGEALHLRGALKLIAQFAAKDDEISKDLRGQTIADIAARALDLRQLSGCLCEDGDGGARCFTHAQSEGAR